MNDRQAHNPKEAEARLALVCVAIEMIEGTVSFAEGAFLVQRLRHRIGGIAEGDQDFEAFRKIESETDHLPLKAQHHLWNSVALTQLQPEFQRAEIWAGEFAPAACARVIARFKRES